MIVYLDQNKWIELAQIYNGKNNSDRDKLILQELKKAVETGTVILPLSAIHYIETARIKDVNRRKKLGETMLFFSKNRSIARFKKIVEYELESALSEFFSHIKVRNLDLLENGISHAFDIPKINGIFPLSSDEIEQACLVGNDRYDIDPLFSKNIEESKKFKYHLDTLGARLNELPRNKRDDLIYAISLNDIIVPLNEISSFHNIPNVFFENKENLKKLFNLMPTRVLDFHLHTQVSKNPTYAAKITDLEDWAGLGVASCYCDLVICEKHMASMFKRDGFKTKARIETNLIEAIAL